MDNQVLNTLLGRIPKDALRQFSRSTVAKWRSGERAPNLESAGRLASLLGITLDEFYARIKGSDNNHGSVPR